MSDQEINITFVGEVEKHDVLYNYKLPGYSRKDLTEKAWQEVAAKVNMSTSECREKWRNLRTVFIRKMKPSPSGSRAKKKAYYLAEAMQFCLPFIKTLAPSSSGNWPHVPHHEKTEIFESVESFYESVSLENSSDTVQSSQASPTQPFSSPSPSSERVLPQHDSPVLPQHSTEHPIPSSSTRGKRSLTMMNKLAADADQCVAEYFKTKKARLKTTVNGAATSSHSSDRKEALEMFLLSLIPELEELSDSQIKLFKRRVFSLIDEISSTSN